MPNCCFKNCKSRTAVRWKNKSQVAFEKLHGKISFHKVPKDTQRRKVWLDRVGLGSSYVSQHAYLCSLHFDNADLDRTSLSCIRLRTNALPKIFPTETSSCDETNSERVEEQHSIKMEQLLHDTSNTSEVPFIKCEFEDFENQQVQQSDELDMDIDIKSEIEAALEENYPIVTTPKQVDLPKLVSVGTIVSPSLSENTPRKVFQRTVLENMKSTYKSKIKSLQQQLRRKEKRIADMQSILTALCKKNLIGAEQLDVLKDLDTVNKHLLKREVAKTNKLSVT
ncbi:uncharacterized protein [Linepithema humile]|uniref:uncharacterized protein n=1 Tax=Linepithema humile TaxID=83485 RepID=UPI00062307BD|nr:PREDICTED: uncharacterized protein LOC105669487 [Linepithema humile]